MVVILVGLLMTTSTTTLTVMKNMAKKIKEVAKGDIQNKKGMKGIDGKMNGHQN